MNDAFTKNEDLSYVLEYCQRDVQILVEFEKKTSMVDDKQNMAMSLNLPMSSVFIQTTAKLVEWTVMRLYHDAGYLCNYSPYIVEDTGKYRGALTYCNPD
jgi:DNA polymerase elongation subunit (family B)